MSVSSESLFHPVVDGAPARARQPQRTGTAPAAAASAGVPRISSQLLLDGGRELVIQHLGGEYHLRLTRNDKLILTK